MALELSVVTSVGAGALSNMMESLHLCLLLALSCLSQAADQGKILKCSVLTKTAPTDVTCPAGQSEPVSRSLRGGERLLYRTQAGRRYTNNVNCTVTFNLGPTCARMKFYCRKVSLKRGDILAISYGGKTRRWGEIITARDQSSDNSGSLEDAESAFALEEIWQWSLNPTERRFLAELDGGDVRLAVSKQHQRLPPRPQVW